MKSDRTCWTLFWILVAWTLAACGAPGLAPTPTPATVRLLADGGGDYATLEEAVQAVAEGGRILLGPGVYRLEHPLRIGKALSLVGAGVDRTEIVAASQGYVVRFSGDGPFAVEDLTFRLTDGAGPDVVVVEGGEAAFARCRFVGAEGAGLRLQMGATGTVQDCAAQGRKWAIGFAIEDQARPTLAGNDCSGNGYGIRVSDQAQPTLVDNTCNDNNHAGIRYDDEAGGVARRNDCSGNGTGILIGGQAQPTLEENTCTGNSMTGIEYRDGAGGLARGNECSRNFGGIGVLDRAQPTLEENNCTGNVTAGIAYFADAGGAARRNGCSDNGIHGIGLFNQARPTLEGNTCTGNGQTGINYADAAAGVARQNECAGNVVGIFVAETANPDLDRNNSYDNTQEDVRDLRP